MMLAELTGLEVGGLICAIAFGGGSLIIAVIALNKKQEVRVEQPVSVTISEELHKVFAAKDAFESHVAENKNDHEKMFSKIGGVERGAAASIEQRVEIVRRDLVAVGNQVAGIQSETKLQNQQLARMDAKLDRLAEKRGA